MKGASIKWTDRCSKAKHMLNGSDSLNQLIAKTYIKDHNNDSGNDTKLVYATNNDPTKIDPTRFEKKGPGHQGENHYLLHIVTRWKRDENGIKIVREGNFMLEVVAIKKGRDENVWAVPEVQRTKPVPETADATAEDPSSPIVRSIYVCLLLPTDVVIVVCPALAVHLHLCAASCGLLPSLPCRLRICCMQGVVCKEHDVPTSWLALQDCRQKGILVGVVGFSQLFCVCYTAPTLTNLAACSRVQQNEQTR
jgi:hypothetical protein